MKEKSNLFLQKKKKKKILFIFFEHTKTDLIFFIYVIFLSHKQI